MIINCPHTSQISTAALRTESGPTLAWVDFGCPTWPKQDQSGEMSLWGHISGSLWRFQAIWPFEFRAIVFAQSLLFTKVGRPSYSHWLTNQMSDYSSSSPHTDFQANRKASWTILFPIFPKSFPWALQDSNPILASPLLFPQCTSLLCPPFPATLYLFSPFIPAGSGLLSEFA